MKAAVIADSSAWDAPAISAFLDSAAIPVRLACLNAEGAPFVSSLWYLHEAGELLACVQEDAFLAGRFAVDPRCGFEVAGDLPPYRGVRGRGEVRIDQAGAAQVLPRLLQRYLGEEDSPLARWLLSRIDTEVLLRIRPVWLTAWDYTPRMRPR